jgi:rhamnose utilization protein RhaD (predicted bifunctional aldolase and dehydrogenase)
LVEVVAHRLGTFNHSGEIRQIDWWISSNAGAGKTRCTARRHNRTVDCVLSVDQSADVPADALGRLVRRARLLAADAETAGAGLRTTTSAKVSRRLGGEVLWVAGAGAVGGDSDVEHGLGSGGTGELAGLRLDRILAAMGDGELDDDSSAASLAGCGVGSNTRPCPPEALLHAVVPATHVDVTQPDGVMALCAAAGGERLAHACFGDAAAWIPYEVGRAELARELGLAAAESHVRMALLARRGLVTWGETERMCHEATATTARRARDFVAAGAHGPRWGGATLAPLGERERTRLLAWLLPVVRTALGSRRPKVLELDTSPAVLDFVCSREAPTLAQTGPVCPPQVLHTQRSPLWVDVDPRSDDAGDLAERIVRGARRHRAHMRWEAAAFGGPDGPLLDPDARVVLIAGVGLVAAGATRTEARRARCASRLAIATIGAATALVRFVSPSAPECGAFERALRAP